MTILRRQNLGKLRGWSPSASLLAKPAAFEG